MPDSCQGGTCSFDMREVSELKDGIAALLSAVERIENRLDDLEGRMESVGDQTGGVRRHIYAIEDRMAEERRRNSRPATPEEVASLQGSTEPGPVPVVVYKNRKPGPLSE